LKAGSIVPQVFGDRFKFRQSFNGWRGRRFVAVSTGSCAAISSSGTAS